MLTIKLNLIKQTIRTYSGWRAVSKKFWVHRGASKTEGVLTCEIWSKSKLISQWKFSNRILKLGKVIKLEDVNKNILIKIVLMQFGFYYVETFCLKIRNVVFYIPRLYSARKISHYNFHLVVFDEQGSKYCFLQS